MKQELTNVLSLLEQNYGKKFNLESNYYVKNSLNLPDLAENANEFHITMKDFNGNVES